MREIRTSGSSRGGWTIPVKVSSSHLLYRHLWMKSFRARPATWARCSADREPRNSGRQYRGQVVFRKDFLWIHLVV